MPTALPSEVSIKQALLQDGVISSFTPGSSSVPVFIRDSGYRLILPHFGMEPDRSQYQFEEVPTIIRVQSLGDEVKPLEQSTTNIHEVCWLYIQAKT